MSRELYYHSLEEASDLIRTRSVSPVELTHALLDRIQELNPLLHAYLTITSDLAIREAALAEAQLSAGDYLGSLHGIPIAYKDNIETKDIRTTGHSRLYRDYVPSMDAAVVSRLRAIGAICLGKLALHELAYGSPEPGDLFPASRNPWDMQYSPGGSSSGCATAVAAGLSFCAVGTDTGGSVRHPAAVCGLVGMKPTFGLISTAGVMPLSHSQEHVGPLTRTVRDNALVLGAILDAASSSHSLPFTAQALMDNIEGGIHGYTVGFPRRFIESISLHPDVGVAFHNAMDELVRLGARIVEINIPMLDRANKVGTRIIWTEAYQHYGKMLHQQPEKFGKPFRDRVLGGQKITDRDRRDDLQFRKELREAYEKFFKRGIDLIVSPGREEPAIKLDDLMLHPFDVRGLCTRMYNVTGFPALVVPMGFSSTGLPLSSQFSGPQYCEPLLYRAARAYERATPWKTSRPPISAGCVESSSIQVCGELQ